ncbi:MAG: hypothetical protein ABJC36_07905 [Gemmatimonadales bacterium]
MLMLGLHALPVLSYQGARQTRWPFLTWAMYARSYPAGPVEIVTRQLIVTSRSGASRQISQYDVGLTISAFNNNYLAPVSRGDSAAARWLIDRLNATGGDSVVELRLQTIRYRMIEPGVATDTLPPLIYRATPTGAR